MTNGDRLFLAVIGAFLLWFGCCSEAKAAITGPPNCAYGFSAGTVISVQTAAFGTRGSSCVTGASNTAGNTIIVHYGYTLNTGTILAVSATDTQGNTYSAVGEAGPFDEIFAGAFYTNNIAGGSGNQVTVTLAATTGGLHNFYVYAEEYAGVLVPTPLDSFNIGFGFGTSVSLATPTNQTGDIVLSNVNSNVGLGTTTAGSGYTLGYQGATNYAVEAQVVGAPGSYTAITNWTASAHVAVFVMAFKAAGVSQPSFNVYHFSAGALTGTTAWSPDAWGDGTSSTSTGGLSGAIANASACDQIVLHHGVTYSAPLTTSTIVIPNTASKCQLLITGDDNVQLPPSGKRIVTGYSTSAPVTMPLIQAAVNFSQPLFSAACAAHDFEFHGIAFGVANGGTTNLSAPLIIGATLNGQLLPQCVGERWSFDQVWASGNYNQPGPCRGIVLEARNSRIINSYFDEFGNYGQDCQAIFTTSMYNALIQNNWIAATTENFMCGGAGTSEAGYSCAHSNFIDNYWVKHIQWRLFASNTDPSVDHRTGCVYYPPDLAYDGVGGGEIWVQGTNSLSGNGAFPPTGTGVGAGTTTTGIWWECGSGGTWQGPFSSKTFTSKYGSAFTVSGNQGNIKNAWELKDGQNMWVWGNVFANMWQAEQSELIILNGPVTALAQSAGGCPNVDPRVCIEASRGTFGVNIEYNVLRDSVGGFAAGGGFPTIAPDPFHEIREAHNILDNVASPLRKCGACAYNTIPNQTTGVSLLGQLPQYQSFTSSNTGPFSMVMTPGGWVVRHNTGVNNAAASAIIAESAAYPMTHLCTSNCTNIVPATIIGAAIIDNVFQLGGGIGGPGSCGSTASQAFNSGGAYLFGFSYPGPYGSICSTQATWLNGSILANNIIAEDVAQGGQVFSNTGGSTPFGATNGGALNGAAQGTTMPGGVSTSSCCLLNYLPTITPTVATPGTGATWNLPTWSWTYPDYTLSTSSTACNPVGTNTTGAPAAPQACTSKASDGTNPGADIPTVMGFTAYAISGASNPNIRFRISSIQATSSSSVLISYQAPIGASNCTFVVSNNENLSSPQGTFNPGGVAPTFNTQVSALSGHFFWGTAACADQVNGGATLTRKFTFQL